MQKQHNTPHRIRRDPAAGSVEGVSDGNVARFLGIPFALPPVGALRFAAPQPVPRWLGVRPALAYGPTAAQPDRGPTLIPEPVEDGDDILNLNIYAPAMLPDRPLPVLVYIHGGGYFGGCNRSEWYDGGAFVKTGVVTVTPGYRLSVEGFMPVEGAPDNRGLLDWIAALEWVRENIAAFGGDPGRVCIAGQSAGAGAVATLIAAPVARGLFHRGILFSGSIGFVGSMVKAEAFARRFEVATGSASNADALADMPKPLMMKGFGAGMIDPADRNQAEGFISSMIDGLPMQPLAGTESLPLPPAEAMAQGAGDDIPVLLTAAMNEFVFEVEPHGAAITDAMLTAVLSRMGLSPERQAAFRALYPGSSPARLMGQAVSDLVFRASMLRMAAIRSQRGAAQSWLADFRWQSSVPMPLPLGAAHCVDMPFYLDKLPLPSATRVLGDAAPADLGQQMHAAICAFIKGESPGWDDWATSGTVRVWDRPDAGMDDMAAFRAVWG